MSQNNTNIFFCFVFVFTPLLRAQYQNITKSDKVTMQRFNIFAHSAYIATYSAGIKIANKLPLCLKRLINEMKQ
jgi:hypothetical protein